MLKSKHALFPTWCAIRNLYHNPNNYHYAYYGGRGLTISKAWDTDFWKFAEDIEALGPRPQGAFLDRKNNDLGHSKRNCYWNTARGNSNNRQTNVMLTYKGRTQSMADWAQEYGLNHRTLWSRINRGYTVEKALTAPLYQGNRK